MGPLQGKCKPYGNSSAPKCSIAETFQEILKGNTTCIYENLSYGLLEAMFEDDGDDDFDIHFQIDKIIEQHNAKKVH